MSSYRGPKPVTPKDKSISKDHIKTGRAQKKAELKVMNKSLTYNKKHENDHKQARKEVEQRITKIKQALKGKYASTR